MRSSLRLSSLSRCALVSSTSLLKADVLGIRQPQASAALTRTDNSKSMPPSLLAALTRTDNSKSMLPSLLAAGAFQAEASLDENLHTHYTGVPRHLDYM